MGFSDSQEADIILALRICNCLSLFGSLSIILVYLIYKSLRSFSFRLIVLMSISDTIRAIGFELSPLNRVSCIFQSLLTNFGSLSSIIWSSVIAYAMYAVIVLENTSIHTHNYLFLFIAYFIPLVLSILPFSTNSIGRAEGWCWFKPDDYQILWRIICFYAILIIAIVFNCCCYYLVIKEVKDELGVLKQSPHEILSKRRFFNRISYYPIVLIICYLPIFGERIYEIASNDSVFWLTLISGMTTSIIGLFNAIVYGFNDNVRDTIYSSCRKRRDSVVYMSTPLEEGGINNSLYD